MSKFQTTRIKERNRLNYIPDFFKNAKLWAECTVYLPLIEGQVPVSKLREQSPLQDLLGCLVLDEVDDDVL